MKYFLFSIPLFFLAVSTVNADETPSPVLPELKEIVTSGPYCGIYSFVAIAKTFGVPPDIKTLLVPEYVSSFQGSSNKELEKLAKDNGLYAKSYSGLTWHEIKNSKTPMILHFRSSFADSKFNHWVAYLGADGKHARIIDFPHPLSTITFAELLAKWDGAAIAVSDKPIDASLAFASHLHYLYLVGFLFGIGFIAQTLFRNKIKEPSAAPNFLLSIKRLFTQTAVLLGTIFILAILYHATSEIGFLKNPTAVAEVTRRYYAVDVPEIALDEMKKAVSEKTVPIFDARYASSFKHGTIPGAKNMAIDSDLTTRQQMMNGIEKKQRIIVFCQSAGCGYADEVAQFLKFNGYADVVIYRNGYREWSQSQ